MQFRRLREDSPFCDSDEEVFVGPVTSEERDKAAKLKRRTQMSFPGIDWTPRRTLPGDAPSSSRSRGEMYCSGQVEEASDKQVVDNLSLALNGLSSSSKEEALDLYERPVEMPERNSELCAASCLNVAQMSDNSDDSLERKHNLTSKRVSNDSLDAKADEATPAISLQTGGCGDKKLFASQSNDSLDGEHHVSCKDSLDSDDSLNVKTFSLNSESSNDSFSNKSHWSQTPSQTFHSVQSDFSSYSESNQYKSCSSHAGGNSSLSVWPVMSVNKEALPQSSEAPTYSVPSDSAADKSFSSAVDLSIKSTVKDAKATGNFSQLFPSMICEVPFDASRETPINTSVSKCDGSSRPTTSIRTRSGQCDVIVPPCENKLSDVVNVDTDGGYLSILSEAALYHASQSQQRLSSHAQQSLEDRFRELGDYEDLEKQQLSESIMYTTGRDSCFLSNSAYFPMGIPSLGAGLVEPFSSKSDGTDKKFVEDDSLPDYDSGSLNLTIKGSNKEVCESELVTCESTSESDQNSLKAANEEICSSNSSFQTYHVESLKTSVKSPHLSTRGEQSCILESRRNVDEPTEVHSVDCDTANCSATSSISEKMNDTLEEYEMIMRYGMDYILGNATKKKDGDVDLNVQAKSKQADTDEFKVSSTVAEEEVQISSLPIKAVENGKPLSQVSSQKFDDKIGFLRTPSSASSKKLIPSKHLPEKSPRTASTSVKTNYQKGPASSIPKVMHGINLTPKQPSTPGPQVTRKMASSITPISRTNSSAFKKPINPVSASKLPKCPSSATTPKSNLPKTNQKILGNVQSPISAYIHNTASPVLVTNVKAKSKETTGWESEMHARTLWKVGGGVSGIPKPKGSQVTNIENFNPNIQCGLPSVKYTRAPCLKLGEPDSMHMPKVSEKITKLLDNPCPQVIKHEGRLNIKSGSPQLAAKVQAAALCPDDSMVGVGNDPGDISVCVSQAAVRTNTLSLKSPSKPKTKLF